MKFSVTKKVFSKFPKAKFGAVLIEDIDNSQEAQEIEKLLDQEVDKVSKELEKANISDLPKVEKWQEIFDKLRLEGKFIPSHQSLLERAKKDKSIPHINPLVDIYNIISLKHRIPIGGHDIAKVGSIRVDETTGGETFQTMNSKVEETVGKGEIAYLSNDKVLTRHFVWRQSETSKTDKNTKSIFIPIDDAPGDMSENDLKKIAFELIRTITKHLGGKAKFEIITTKNKDVNFEQSEPVDEGLLKVKTKWTKYQKIAKIKSSEMKVVTDEKKIDAVLSRGVKDIFPDKESLKEIMMSGKKLRLYTGIDPTANFLHVGHFIWMKKLSKFQQLGHQVIFMIGGFTAMIGDPDKEHTREPLTKEQVWKNFESYEETARKIINFDWKQNPITILNNFDWLSKVTLEDWLEIMSSITMQRILSHEMFSRRIEKEKPIRLHEVCYPLMQGFDSVAMKVNLEVGGSDQTFNMLTGRLLSRNLLNKEKLVLTLKLLADKEGTKMGKTTGNAIASTDSSEDMYGKIMAWTDSMIFQGFELLTDVDLNKFSEKNIKKDPMQYKKKLAFEIVKLVKGKKSAKKAQDHFEQTFQKQETPDNLEKVGICGKTTGLELGKKLVEEGIIKSNSQAKRLIQQGAISVNDKKIKSLKVKVKLCTGDVLKIGKKRFFEIEEK